MRGAGTCGPSVKVMGQGGGELIGKLTGLAGDFGAGAQGQAPLGVQVELVSRAKAALPGVVFGNQPKLFIKAVAQIGKDAVHQAVVQGLGIAQAGLPGTMRHRAHPIGLPVMVGRATVITKAQGHPAIERQGRQGQLVFGANRDISGG